MFSVSNKKKIQCQIHTRQKIQKHFQLSKQQMKDYPYLQELHSSKKLIQGPLNPKPLRLKNNILLSLFHHHHHTPLHNKNKDPMQETKQSAFIFKSF